MAVPIRLPDLGTNVEECKVHLWRVQPGQRVKRGDVLAEIETDKAVAELESTAEGVLLRQVVNAGDPACTGDVLAYVGEAGEPVPDSAAAVPPTGAAPQAARSPGVQTPAASGGVRRLSPLVRNLAVKLAVDLDSLRGTGAGGVITREDVLAASRAPAATPAGELLSPGQAAVARAVSRSWKEIPHLYVTVSLDMTAVQRLRADRAAEDVRPSFDAIFLKALARAVTAVPWVAARLEGGRVVKARGIHIALAMGFGNELFLPVIRDVDRKDVRTIQKEISGIAAQLRARTLNLGQMTGGCMALSNLGMYPVEAFEGIIFPEHSAILSVGAAQETPVAVGGRVEVRSMAKATLAADHRLINGRTAAEFLSNLKLTIESGDFA